MRIRMDSDIAKRILNEITNHARLNTSGLGHQHSATCFYPHHQKLLFFIEQALPLSFVLPAFPAKSPNKKKTVGPLPDLGERLALRFLQQMCERIRQFYPPGANIVICSDGRVFNDLVQVSDQHVAEYGNRIHSIIANENLHHLSTYCLDDYYKNMSYQSMRTHLMTEYSEPIEALKGRIKEIHSDKLLFNGIHRFIFEDALTWSEGKSRNQVREQSKYVAYGVIQRSNAWSNCIATIFPHAIRLSIHPQLCGSKKLGIMLIKTSDAWATPWHRVIMKQNQQYHLVRREVAEIQQANPIYEQEEFSHYAI